MPAGGLIIPFAAKSKKIFQRLFGNEYLFISDGYKLPCHTPFPVRYPFSRKNLWSKAFSAIVQIPVPSLSQDGIGNIKHAPAEPCTSSSPRALSPVVVMSPPAGGEKKAIRSAIHVHQGEFKPYLNRLCPVRARLLSFPLSSARSARRSKASTIHDAPWEYCPPFSRTPGG